MRDPQTDDGYPDPPNTSDPELWWRWMCGHPDPSAAITTAHRAAMTMWLLEWMVGWIGPDFRADLGSCPQCRKRTADVLIGSGPF